MNAAHRPSAPWPGSKIFLLVVLIWILLVLASLLTQRNQMDKAAFSLARTDAIANLKKDMDIRKWASSVDGVFIREEFVPPFNALEEEQRVTVTRNDGTQFRLVKVTPMHLLLAIQETSNQANRDQPAAIRERLTSLQLRNIENAPDDWETQALDTLKDGADIVVESMSGKRGHGLMRVMIPMRMEEECLDCHRDTLVPVGGLRGGAAISINLNAYRAIQEPTWRAIQYWHLGIALLGLTGIFIFQRFARRRRTELILQEEMQRENEMAFAAMAEGAVITDDKATILWVNDAFCRILGFTREEVIGRNPSMLKSGLHDPNFYQALWHQLTLTGHWRGEIWNKRRNGEIFPEEISIQALRAPDGTVRRYISIFSDITERKKNETELTDYRNHLEELVRQRTEELTVARDQAEAANLSKSIFLANMNHELRTPLNAVIGFSQLMEKDTSLSEKQQRNLEIINASGHHLLTLIDDILELSKIESGKMEMRIEDVSLTELLEQIIAMMRLRAEQANLSLHLETRNLPPSVQLDPAMLRQVLLNLLSNAIKFTPGGHIRVVAQGIALPDPSRLQLHFCVKDTGIGISPADRERIFSSFEQVNPTPQGGTGLGLAISRKYVEMMGGCLNVDSEPGQGANFYFSLTVSPHLTSTPKQHTVSVTGLVPEDHGRHILIIDSLSEARLLVRSLLEPLGFNVSEASTLATAEKIILSNPPELILTDWFLPDGNGTDFLHTLRDNPDTMGLRLIMLTANASDESRNNALAAGANGFLSKPFQENELYRMLEQQLTLRFIWGEPAATKSTDTISRCSSQIIEALGQLSSTAREQINQAAISLSPQQISHAIQEIAREHPQLAEALNEIATARQYRTLWRLLGILEEDES